MQVICSNCSTAHNITFEDIHRLGNPVIHCSNCEKRIKIQFCPHCGAFYSITFSNLQNGQYRYKCKKCSAPFTIDFFEGEPASGKPVRINQEKKTEDEPAAEITPPGAAIPEKKAEKDEVSFLRNSINTFTVHELLSITSGAFSLKKILASSAFVIFMLILLRIFSMIDSLYFSSSMSTASRFTGSMINLIPLAVMFSFFTLASAVVSKITLHRLFHNCEPAGDEVIGFAVKTAPGILLGNVILLLIVNSLLILFGNIPFIGPLLFSLSFLPVYTISIVIFIILFTGFWFYPPIAAHRENGIITNLKNLLLFIKKHNLNLLFIIPVMMLLTIVTSSLIYLIHTSALAITMSLSQAVLHGNLAVFMSSIPAGFIKASESAFTNIDSGIFRGLYETILPVHQLGGIISGLSMSVITVMLLSIFISVTGTISSHIYIMMERGISVDDRKKAVVLFILTLMLTTLIQIKKLL